LGLPLRHAEHNAAPDAGTARRVVCWDEFQPEVHPGPRPSAGYLLAIAELGASVDARQDAAAVCCSAHRDAGAERSADQEPGGQERDALAGHRTMGEPAIC